MAFKTKEKALLEDLVTMSAAESMERRGEDEDTIAAVRLAVEEIRERWDIRLTDEIEAVKRVLRDHES